VPLFASLLLLVSLGGQTEFGFLASPSSQADLDRYPAKRYELELSKADSAFDNARDAYVKGDFEKGDAGLEEMTKALDSCLGTLEEAHKARFYKKAELRVANLQRRMTTLLDDIELPKRGWAEQTSRKLEDIHDKLLAGVMRK